MSKNSNTKFKIDLTHQQMGNWYVVYFVTIINTESVWFCRCGCGNERELTREQLSRAKKTNRKHCWKCDKISQRNTKEGLRTRHFNKIKKDARHRHIDFQLTEDYLRELFDKQNGLCALSGDKLYFEIRNKIENTTTASLDRIDSSKGYVKGNVQWVHKDVNLMKNKTSQAEFISWCRLVAANQSTLANPS